MKLGENCKSLEVHIICTSTSSEETDGRVCIKKQINCVCYLNKLYYCLGLARARGSEWTNKAIKVSASFVLTHAGILKAF